MDILGSVTLMAWTLTQRLILLIKQIPRREVKKNEKSI